MLEQLDVYISAQKAIATYMLSFGLILILLAIIIHFAGTNSLFYGFKIGLMVFGLFSSIGGYSYKLTEEKLLESQTALHQVNAQEFHQLEKERMQKVAKNFPVIQFVFVAVIIIALLVILLLNKAFISGVLFSLIIFLLGNMIIESVSKNSIDTYFEQLSTMNQ
jgi:hypothetical protein